MLGSSFGFVRQIQGIGIVYIGVIVHGMSIGYSSAAIPNILWETYHSNVTDFFIPSIDTHSEELSWFASCLNLGQIIGGILGGYSGGAIGPRKTILISCIPTILGWSMIAFGPNLELLIIGRVLTGVGGATVSANSVMLVQQFSSTGTRGFFLSLYAMVASLGILFAFCFGALLYWRYAAIVPIVLITVMGVGFLGIKESPIWLLGHHGEEAAREALIWIRARDDVTEELEEMKKAKETTGGLTMIQALKNCRRPDIFKPVLLIVLCFTLGMLTGIQAVIFYAVEIFMNSGIEFDNNIAAIIIAAIRAISGLIAPIFEANCTRRRVGIICSVMMMMAMMTLGTYMYLKKFNLLLLPGMSVVPVASLVVFTFAYGSGVGPLQTVWLGEFLPPEYKIISGLLVSEGNLMVFITTKLFPLLEMSLQPHGTYWLFSGFCFLNLLMCLFIMPETKGLSILEIRELFQQSDCQKQTTSTTSDKEKQKNRV